MNEYTGPEDVDTRKKLTWTIHVDGSSTSGTRGASLILRGPHGVKISYALKFGFRASNNESECEALVAALKVIKHIGAEKVQIFSDSILDV